MPARNVNLTARLSAFVDFQVETGRHQNASEVVREALRRYESATAEDHERVQAIREMIAEGRAAHARGEFIEVATEQDRQALLERLTGRRPRAIRKK